MSPEREWELILHCRSGQTSAYEPLVRGHERDALRIATALLGDPDEAEDAVQDAFVKAYRSLSRLAEGSAFGPWFRTIVRNGCRDRLRSRHRRTAAGEAVLESIEGETAEAGSIGGAERVERSAVVWSALGSLTSEHREVLVFKEMEGMSYAEIARATGIPPGTVASRLHHARAELRSALEVRGVTMEWVP